ncbi:MAG: lipase family protein [Acidimicrobiia bacterium]|nr:lipase family protein [Acidimicrobiia bacterium]
MHYFMRSAAVTGVLVAGFLVAGLLVPAPLHGQSLTASDPIIGPEGDAFYEPPDPLPLGEPGELIWYRETEELPAGAGRSFQVLYHSRREDGADTTVSGSVSIPDGSSPPGGWPIESYGHPTTGITDCDAPSLWGGFGPSIPATIDARTDYEGLGTPGEHTYLVGGALGRNMLDIARAARQLPGVDAANQVVLRGFSEGGHAALFAGEQARSYAPELDVVGVVAAAPAVELLQLLKTSARTPSAIGYAGYAAWGYSHAYDLSLADVLTPEAIDALTKTADCMGDPPERSIWDFTADEALIRNPWELPDWQQRIDQNTPGTRPSIPVWIFAGGKDLVVPVKAINGYVGRACEQGTHVTLFVHPSGGHEGITDGGLIDEWVDARRAHEPLGESTCDTDEPPPPTDRPPGGEEGEPPVVGAAQPATPTPGTPTFTG